MARLKLLRLSTIIASAGGKKERFLTFINIIIFVSIFALSAALISMYFENEIDKIDNKIINEEKNDLVFANQIQQTPLVLKNIQEIVDLNKLTNNYIDLLSLSPEDSYPIVMERETEFKPFWKLLSLANYVYNNISISLSDAILISNNVNDIEKIEKINLEFKKIDEKKRGIEQKKNVIQNEWAKQERMEFELKESNEEAAEKKMVYYRKLGALSDELTELIELQKIFLIKFNLKFFSEKQKESQKFVKKLQKELEVLSKQESLIILIAFILQLLIFLSVQYFEVTIEGQNAKRTKKK